jgi:hypothetical protein
VRPDLSRAGIVGMGRLIRTKLCVRWAVMHQCLQEDMAG